MTRRLQLVIAIALGALFCAPAFPAGDTPWRAIPTRPWLYAYEGSLPSAELVAVQFTVGDRVLDGDALTLDLGDTLRVAMRWRVLRADFAKAHVRAIVRAATPGQSPAFLEQQRVPETAAVGEVVEMVCELSLKLRSFVGEGVLRMSLIEDGADWTERATMYAIPVTVPPVTWPSRVRAADWAAMMPAGSHALGQTFRLGPGSHIDVPGAPPANGPSTAVTVFSACVRDEDIKVGDALCRVDALDGGGAVLASFDIRFGIDTANSTGSSKLSPAYLVPWKDDDGEIALTRVYRAGFPLDRLMPIARLRFTFLRDRGALDVDDVVLSSEGGR